jgi:hypothetical protein
MGQGDQVARRRGVSKSLDSDAELVEVCDHCLILHPEQQARAAAKKPLYTIGSLQRHLKLEVFTVWREEWLEGEGLDN